MTSKTKPRKMKSRKRQLRRLTKRLQHLQKRKRMEKRLPLKLLERRIRQRKTLRLRLRQRNHLSLRLRRQQVELHQRKRKVRTLSPLKTSNASKLFSTSKKTRSKTLRPNWKTFQWSIRIKLGREKLARSKSMSSLKLRSAKKRTSSWPGSSTLSKCEKTKQLSSAIERWSKMKRNLQSQSLPKTYWRWEMRCGWPSSIRIWKRYRTRRTSRQWRTSSQWIWRGRKWQLMWWTKSSNASKSHNMIPRARSLIRPCTKPSLL